MKYISEEQIEEKINVLKSGSKKLKKDIEKFIEKEKGE